MNVNHGKIPYDENSNITGFYFLLPIFENNSNFLGMAFVLETSF